MNQGNHFKRKWVAVAPALAFKISQEKGGVVHWDPEQMKVL